CPAGGERHARREGRREGHHAGRAALPRRARHRSRRVPGTPERRARPPRCTVSAGRTAIRIALGLLPELVDWVADRIEGGESVETIRRDIKDRRAEVAANRVKRDEEFAGKFGGPDGTPTRQSRPPADGDAQHVAELERLR